MSLYEIELMMSTSRAADTLKARAVCRLEWFSFSSQESVVAVFGSPVHWTEDCFFRTCPIWEPMRTGLPITNTETKYANTPYPTIGTHILKDLAYKMYFECPVVIK